MKVIYGENEGKEVAKKVLSFLKLKEHGATIVTLKGDLGSGKTTLVKHLLSLFGVKEIVVSPTFVLMKQYTPNKGAWKKIIHIDAYRFDTAEEILSLGWKELEKETGTLIFLEWPEKVFGQISHIDFEIELFHRDNEKRELNIA